MSYRIGIVRGHQDADSSHSRHSDVSGSLGRSCDLSEDVQTRSPSSDGVDEEYLAALRKNHLEVRARSLSHLFPQTDIGRALARSATLMSFEPSNSTPEGRIVREALSILENDPQATLDDISQIIPDLGLEMTAERQFLIQMVSRLNLDTSAKLALLSEELDRIALSQEESLVSYTESERNKINCSIVLSAMMSLDPDPSVIDSTLRQLLGRLKAYDVRTFLLSIYQTKFPEEARNIRTDLGIQDQN